MINTPVFKRNFVLFSVIVGLFFSLAVVFNWVYRDIQKEKFNQIAPFPIIISELLDEIDSDPLLAVKKVTEKKIIMQRENIDILNAQGVSLITNIQLTDSPILNTEIQKVFGDKYIIHKKSIEGFPVFITGTKDVDMFYAFSPKNPGRRHQMGLPWLQFIVILIFVLIAIAISLFVMFKNYRTKSIEALTVLDKIRQGDLSIRIKSEGLQELQPIVVAFNKMLDEVSSLVSSLKKTDEGRRRLLQDLAHDLRTPLTSVKSFLETLHDSSDKIDVVKQKKILGFCLIEVNYFSNLVEDLLFLANISEPNYVLANENVQISEIAEGLSDLFQIQSQEKKISMIDKTDGQQILLGSAKLFERLLRNGISNACSFSTSKVDVILEKSNDELSITLIDDGPGFDKNSLNDFGIKKSSRHMIQDLNKSRISLGIGSLIMKEITLAHRGSIHHQNMESNGTIKGALVKFTFPIHTI